jgi:hypothetical protein
VKPTPDGLIVLIIPLPTRAKTWSRYTKQPLLSSPSVSL